MPNQNELTTLRNNIRLLEQQQLDQLVLMKEQFKQSYKSIQPINLIKNTLHDAASDTGIKNSLLDSVIGITTGYVTGKLLSGRAPNPIRRVLAGFIQFAVANLVANRSSNHRLSKQP